MKRFIMGAALLLGLVAYATPASAGLFFYPGDTNQLIYNNFESLFRPISGTTAFEVSDPFAIPLPGDYLAGMFQVNRINNLDSFATNIPDTTAYTGVFAQQIVSVTPIGPGQFSIVLTNPSLFTFTDGTSTFTLSDLSSNEMFAIYSDSVASGTLFNPTGTLASSVGTATDGSLLATAGINLLNPNNGTTASALLTGPAAPFIVAHGSLTFVDNNTGLTFVSHSPDSFTLSPPLGAGELTFESRININNITNSPWTYTSFDPAEVQPNVVPEPTSLILLGFGTLGAGLVRRKKLIA